MENIKNFKDQTMDDMVFEKKNKSYGAYFLRMKYAKNLMLAMIISTLLFSTGMVAPSVAKKLGFFQKVEEKADTHLVKAKLVEPPRLQKELPPPPPPPPVEIKRPTTRYVEMKAAKKEEVDEPPPPDVNKLKGEIDDKTVDAPETNLPPPIKQEVTGGEPAFDPNAIVLEVQQKPEFKINLQAWIQDNMQYPQEDHDYGVEGETEVTFLVNVSGDVEGPYVSKKSGSKTLDAEALRLIRRSSGMWKPARQGGRNVKTYAKVTINFTLEDE